MEPVLIARQKECEHEYKVVIDQEPTCGEAGSQHQECTICGQTEMPTTIPATGSHAYGDWTIVEQATTTKTGTKQRVCSVCGTKETTVIEKLAETGSNPMNGAGSSGANAMEGNVSSGESASNGNLSSAGSESEENLKTIKIKLNSKKKLSLRKGQKIKVKVKGIPKKDKVVFKSSNKKVATVNARGIVKIKKAGKITITMKCGKKEAKIIIKVKK